MGGSCREYTLPRDDQLSKVKGWTRGNTKIGPVLEVAVSYHQGWHGIEIRIKSLLDDGSHSWIMIVNGLNKYETEMSGEIQENRSDEIGASAERLAAKARPKQTSVPMSFSPRVAIPFSHARMHRRRTRREYDQSSCEVSKKMIRLLRHDPSVLREEDGAVEFNILAPMFASTFASSPHWSIRTWLRYLQRGGPKTRFQYCLDSYSAETIYYFRAIQGHSGGEQINPALQDSVLLPSDFAEYSTTLEAPTTCTLSSNQD